MTRFVLLIQTIAVSICISACASQTALPALYDLGLLHATQASPPSLPPISIAEVNAPAWLDSPLMYFRLSYANEQQPHPYATSRWSMPPIRLFAQRLKARIAQTGGAVISATDGATNIPVLHIDADDFTQIFDSPGKSNAYLAVRASVFNGRILVAQKTFIQQSPAPTPDAAGGAKALAVASDTLITQMMIWLSQLPLKK